MTALESSQVSGTKKALIEAATSLFAEHGFDSVSLRDITGRAGANVASVNYHFDSKEGLVDAVVERLIGPVNEGRLARLTEVLESGDLTVRNLLRGFHEPLLARVKGSELGEQLFCKLMGRLVGERPYQFPTAVMSQFHQVAKGYVPAFKKACPHLTTKDVFWNIHFSFGVVSNTLMHGDLLTKISEGAVKSEELEQTMARVIDFCEAGFLKGGQK